MTRALLIPAAVAVLAAAGCGGSGSYSADGTIPCLKDDGAVVSYRAVTGDYTVDLNGGLLSGGNQLALSFADDSKTAQRGIDAITGDGLAAYRRNNVVVIWADAPTTTEREEVEGCLA